MKFTELGIKGVYLVETQKIEDHRGHFFRTYCEDEFERNGLKIHWKQTNHSFTKARGAFRGIHFQVAPYSEYKLIRCISGSVIDFGVDLRKGSATLFGHVHAELSADNHAMLLLPPGVGHAFQTLEDNTALVYMHSAPYMPGYEGGVFYDDKKIKLPLPLRVTELSEKDSNYAGLPDDFGGIDYE
jgi:dTDP-4-dehydrorhamnose 3,5-epimerase